MQSEMPAKRSPAWTREETILALDLYLRIRGEVPGPDDKHPDVMQLSQTLNALAVHAMADRPENFRNPQSVSLKLLNFRWIDPSVPGGMRGASALMSEVWDKLADDPVALNEMVAEISKQHQVPNTARSKGGVRFVDEGDVEPLVVVEGHPILTNHYRRERDRGVVTAKKLSVLQASGRLECEVCGFDYEQAYGEHGAGYIECHHTQPLSTVVDSTETRLEDLALVCANCHRMLHRHQAALSLDDLRQILSSAVNTPT